VRVAADTFLIQVDNPTNSTIGVKGVNGSDISVDTDYNKYKHSNQIGKIYALPILITNKYINDVTLSVGDIVVFHHFVCQPDHKMPLGENIYRCEYFHIYGKVENGYLYPVEDIVFVEPVMEDEKDIFVGSIQIKPRPELLSQQGIVFSLSETANKSGLKVLDKVYYTRNADYKMAISGRDLYRMRLRNIVLIERQGEIVCPKDRILIKQHPKGKETTLFCEKRNLQLVGEVVKVGEGVDDFKEGNVVDFYPSLGGGVEKDGVMYFLVEERHINYLIN
jgi:hypothetical protein